VTWLVRFQPRKLFTVLLDSWDTFGSPKRAQEMVKSAWGIDYIFIKEGLFLISVVNKNRFAGATLNSDVQTLFDALQFHFEISSRSQNEQLLSATFLPTSTLLSGQRHRSSFSKRISSTECRCVYQSTLPTVPYGSSANNSFYLRGSAELSPERWRFIGRSVCSLLVLLASSSVSNLALLINGISKQGNTKQEQVSDFDL